MFYEIDYTKFNLIYFISISLDIKLISKHFVSISFVIVIIISK